jgi:hypothetical protein
MHVHELTATAPAGRMPRIAIRTLIAPAFEHGETGNPDPSSTIPGAPPKLTAPPWVDRV